MSRLPVVFAITGASGAPYAVRLLQVLATTGVPVWLIVSGHGLRLLEQETGIADLDALEHATSPRGWKSVQVFDDADRGAAPASGSARVSGMVVCPCSMGTLSAIAHGTSRSLIERAADVQLKERRKLVLVTRETPLSLVHLRNMTAVSEAGAVVMPAAPGFYNKPAAVADLVDFIVQRVLDQLGVEAQLVPRWGEKIHGRSRRRP